MGAGGSRVGQGVARLWGREGVGGRVGAMGTSGMCQKSCKRFGAKNARGDGLLAKKEVFWAKMEGGPGQRMHFVAKSEFSWVRKNASLLLSNI